MNTEQPSRNQNYGPLCALECGSLLPPLFVWSCSASGKAQASLRTPKRTPQECWKNPCPDCVCSGNLSSVIGHLEETADLALGLPHSTKRPYFKRRASFNSIL